MKLIRLFPSLLPLALGSCGLYFGPPPTSPPCRPGLVTQISGEHLDENVSRTLRQGTNAPAGHSDNGATFTLDRTTNSHRPRPASDIARVIPEEVP